jgi:hypothetical protein
MIEGPKLSNFKLGGLKLQNGENRETKLQLSLFFSNELLYSVTKAHGLKQQKAREYFPPPSQEEDTTKTLSFHFPIHSFIH